MAESKMEFKYFKSEEEFVKRLEFIRHYFGPEATNILNKNFVFNNGATRDGVMERYNNECARAKMYELKQKLMPKFFHQYMPAVLWYNEEYAILISLMDILKTDVINTTELDFVLAQSKHFFETYFDENLKSTTSQDEME